VKITIQTEAFQGTIVQQQFEVEYVVANQQCAGCAKSYTHHSWQASVQVRQKVPHKRTFLYLEQLILKHNAHKDTVNIKEVNEGLDFYFAKRNEAERMLSFLQSQYLPLCLVGASLLTATGVVPCTVKKSHELISMDIHTSTSSYKFNFSVSIIPICKDDLVALPIKLARSLSDISPLVICHRVGTSINLMDPCTLRTADLPSSVYWRQPFPNLADTTELREFIILDIESTGHTNGRYLLSEATVARASDLGSNDTTYFTRTHLGGVLHVGDSVLGYHLSGTQFNNDQFDAIENSNQYGSTIPDVVLIKKHYVRSKKSKARSWRLKRMAREHEEEATAAVVNVPTNKRQEQEQARMEQDYEMFLRDVEEDQELRQTLDLYKNRQYQARPDQMDEDDDEDMDEDGNAVPKINMDELLDDFDELNMEDN
jgi:nonsense-mediated mRNA decay protein 3